MKTITTIEVRSASAAYTVEIGTGILAGVGERINTLLDGGLTSGQQRVFVVTSPEIWKLWGEQLSSGFTKAPVVLMVAAGEERKRMDEAGRLAEELAAHGADRDSVLLAFGGGVIGDLTGFVAAIYMRGIRYVQVPTTLLAQVDSSVGGKTGVNLVAGKNLVGAFHHPLAVYADIDTLTTLPEAELRAGLQEAVKAGIIRDAALFDLLERESGAILGRKPEVLLRVVAASVGVKAEVVSLDEREGGLRMILNLGHTLGHAIEAATGYGKLLHGEAVAWGMLAAVDIAERRELISDSEAQRIQRVIRFYGPLRSFDVEAGVLVELTSKDKKNRSGRTSFVLPVGIGNAAVFNDVSEAELLRAAEAITAEAGARVSA